jgi:hypothetical protein
MRGPFQVNAPAAVAEIIDNELVVMNLETGTYYSSLDFGVVVWRWIEAGATIEQIVHAIVSYTGIQADGVRSDIESFVDSLARENLIRAAATATPSAAPIAPPDMPYQPPKLNVYSDMQDLLMLDPIHDVDAVGWPSLPPQAAKAETE